VADAASVGRELRGRAGRRGQWRAFLEPPANFAARGAAGRALWAAQRHTRLMEAPACTASREEVQAAVRAEVPYVMARIADAPSCPRPRPRPRPAAWAIAAATQLMLLTLSRARRWCDRPAGRREQVRMPPQLVERHPQLVDYVTELEEGYTDCPFDLSGVLARIFVWSHL
jgi:hypothetical protein